MEQLVLPHVFLIALCNQQGGFGPLFFLFHILPLLLGSRTQPSEAEEWPWSASSRLGSWSARWVLRISLLSKPICKTSWLYWREGELQGELCLKRTFKCFQLLFVKYYPSCPFSLYFYDQYFKYSYIIRWVSRNTVLSYNIAFRGDKD